MKKKIFIAYFPVILVGCQVLVNLMYFVIPSVYYDLSFYLNHFLGVNMMIGIYFVVMTWTLKFCYISRWAAIAEILFGINYMVIQQDNLYNIVFQITIGMVAIIITSWHYIKRFPLCRLSLLVHFIQSVAKKGSCEKGIENWKGNVIKHYHANRSRL
jgi:hypothetical protein